MIDKDKASEDSDGDEFEDLAVDAGAARAHLSSKAVDSGGGSEEEGDDDDDDDDATRVRLQQASRRAASRAPSIEVTAEMVRGWQEQLAGEHVPSLKVCTLAPRHKVP